MDASAKNLEARESRYVIVNHGATGLPGVYVKTFGCQMNEYDSEKILLCLSQEYRAVESAERAQLIIVNTCSVRDKAEQKLYSFVGSLRRLKELTPGLIIGVAGCVAQQEGENILRKSRLVDFVVGTQNISVIPELVSQARRGGGGRVAISCRSGWEKLPDPELASAHDAADSISGRGALSSLNKNVPGAARALIAVQRGCNKHCSFCVVPKTRGPQVSREIEEIEREVSLKVAAGAKEVLLLGQTVNSYGLDLKPQRSFEEVLLKVAAIKGVERIRFTSPHPAHMTVGLVRLFGEIPLLCPHVHLPLQSGSNRILKLMRRSYTAERYLEIVEQFREVRPDMAFTSDIIVGFPTETSDDFELTLDMMRKVRFHSAFSFKYSRRPNTLAMTHFGEDDEVADEIGGARLSALQTLQDTISQQINQQLVGRHVEVLVEGHNKKISSLMRGRTPHNILVELTGGCPKTGDTVRALVEYAGCHGVRGVIQT